MKQLKNCIKLSCSVKIYVPSTFEVTKAINNAEYVDITLEQLSSLFGGATATEAYGAWITAKGTLIKEKVTLVISYTDQQKLETHIDSVYDFCLRLKSDLKQESISLEVNGELYFV